jgi:ferredoxin
MATMITEDCINCGACEPECPNNAISAGDPVYVIDPLLCTECVGFHDYEACAAVCPADCCVTDPDNTETEEALFARAKTLHQEIDFGETFESRFRKSESKEGEAQPSENGSSPAAEHGASPDSAAAGAGQGTGIDMGTLDLSALALPDAGDWEITARCFKCNETYSVTAKRFLIGNVLFCPHCFKSMVVKDSLNFQVRSTLKESHDGWSKRLEEFQVKREKEIKEFQQKLEDKAKALEKEREQVIQTVQGQLKQIAESYNAPGRPTKKRSLLAWG